MRRQIPIEYEGTCHDCEHEQKLRIRDIFGVDIPVWLCKYNRKKIKGEANTGCINWKEKKREVRNVSSGK
jgi:hypothetical protein